MKSCERIICTTILLIFVLFITVDYAQTESAKGQSPSGFHLIKKVELGGEGGWDYLIIDSQARRLYVSRSTRVDVLDVDSGTKVGEIPNTNGVHGIAIDLENGHGYTSNGRDSSVTIFDLKTLKEINKVSVEKNPDAIIYDPASKRVFAYNRGSSSVSAIDCSSGKVVGTMALGGHPEFSVSDRKGMIYVNLDNKSELIAFDAQKLEIKNRWPIAPGEKASGLAMDRKNRRLFIVCDNKMMIVMNADNGKVLANIPTGEGTDAAAFDRELKLAFSSNGEGTLTIVCEESADKFSVLDNIQTQRGARTMALDAKTHNVWLATAQFGPPPAPTADRPRPRPSIVPNSFVLLVYGK
jgi:YVTN family beta-propeller protein